MTITEALNTARSRIRLVNYGRQYCVHSWSPRHNATYVSNMTDYWKGRAGVRENRICEALRLLGVEDADCEGFDLARNDGRWDDLVRWYMTKRAQVAA